MKFQIKYFVSALLVLTLLAGWTVPAYAAELLSITPSTITNDVENKITITGNGFDSTSIVLLNDSALVDTLFLNDKTLRITIPSGFTPNTYIVSVTMSDPTPVTGTATLTVNPAVPTATPAPFGRPQLVVTSYSSGKAAQAGKEFKLNLAFENAGTSSALNVQAAFSSADLVPTKTGGVQALGTVAAGGASGANQTFLALDSITGKQVVVIDVTFTYYDDKGASYSDKLTLSVPVKGEVVGGGVAYPTATPTGVNTAQLVITSYASTVDPLQPGEQFQLGITVENMGNTIAKGVTMIIGGGSSGSGGGTAQPGGVSGGSGEFTNFAPVGTSNIQSLGDLAAGGALQVKQNLIVNVSTTPGAYPMKITFSYVNKNGEVVNDDQVITLLVYSLPNVDVSFYRPPDPFFAGQPGALPIQVVNLGKRNSVLGSMKIEAIGGTLDPSSTLIGSLDPGGYFTFDSTVFPDAAGTLELTITIDYTDDFNQSRVITKTLELTVEEMMIDPSIDPSLNGGGGGGEVVADETFFQKVWRFVLGVLGLDSAPPDSGGGISEPLPDQQIVPMPAGGGGKG